MALPAYIQLAILLVAVPLQYYLTTQVAVPEIELRARAASFMSRLHHLYEGALDLWKDSSDTQLMLEKFLNFFMSPASGRPNRAPSPASSSPVNTGQFEDEEALEVEREKEKWFAQSSDVRRQELRSGLLFRVGQTVYHSDWNWRGVVVGWDEAARVPAYWLEENGLSSDDVSLKGPWYLVLVDQTDTAGLTAYVPQSALRMDEEPELEITHPHLGTFFKATRTADNRYVLLPWLRERYPND